MQCRPYIDYHTDFFLENSCTYRNLHIEPFNHAIESVCFDFGSTIVGSSVSERVELRALFYPTSSSFDVITL